MKKFGLLMVALAAIYMSGCTQIPAGHRGVRTNWNRAVAQTSDGMQWYTPFKGGIIHVDCRTHKVEHKTNAASHDLQTVNTTVAVNYHLDPNKVMNFFKTVGYEQFEMEDGEKNWTYVDKVITPRIDEVIKAVTPKYRAAELITKREQVKREVETELTKRLAKYNIIVESNGVSLRDFSFSPEFDKSIEEKQIAEQRAQKASYELQQAEIERQIAVTKARGQQEANNVLSLSLNDKILAKMWIDTWNGELPQATSGQYVYVPRAIQQSK